MESDSEDFWDIFQFTLIFAEIGEHCHSGSFCKGLRAHFHETAKAADAYCKLTELKQAEMNMVNPVRLGFLRGRQQFPVTWSCYQRM